MSKDVQGSTSQAVGAGLLIAMLCLPLLIAAVPAGGFVAWRLLAAATHRPVFVYVTYAQPGGLELGAHLVGAVVVGIMAALLVAISAVKIVARGADPRVLFRVGALGLAGSAAALWWWSSAGGAVAPIDHGIVALLAWLGTLVGMRFACGLTDAARRVRAKRALPDRARLGLPPIGDDGRTRSAGPWDQGCG